MFSHMYSLNLILVLPSITDQLLRNFNFYVWFFLPSPLRLPWSCGLSPPPLLSLSSYAIPFQPFLQGCLCLFPPPHPTTQHEFSIQVGGSSLMLTLKFPRSDCTSSPLAAADFLVISYKNLVLDWHNNFYLISLSMSILITCLLDNVWIL